jgi:BirA family biotin operon repressor/biotin-[acetyl-CoA-carboxylase] ligase
VAGSTNDIALEWARSGAEDGSLVVADTQTSGRGRESRQWVTNSGSALAMSLILRPSEEESEFIPRFSALPALGLVRTLDSFGLEAQVKWPNDVLLNGKKVAGVLVEGEWQGDRLIWLAVGMGVNVSPEAIPSDSELRYPATSIETELGQVVDRWTILAEILHAIQYYRSILTSEYFLEVWNARLAFMDQTVLFRFPDRQVKEAKVMGVQLDGRLKLELDGNEVYLAVAGEIDWLDR